MDLKLIAKQTTEEKKLEIYSEEIMIQDTFFELPTLVLKEHEKYDLRI